MSDMELLTTKQVADQIGVSQTSVLNYIRDGKIKAQKTSGGHNRVSPSEVTRYILESSKDIKSFDVIKCRRLEVYQDDFQNPSVVIHGPKIDIHDPLND